MVAALDQGAVFKRAAATEHGEHRLHTRQCRESFGVFDSKFTEISGFRVWRPPASSCACTDDVQISWVQGRDYAGFAPFNQVLGEEEDSFLGDGEFGGLLCEGFGRGAFADEVGEEGGVAVFV